MSFLIHIILSIKYNILVEIIRKNPLQQHTKFAHSLSLHESLFSASILTYLHNQSSFIHTAPPI